MVNFLYWIGVFLWIGFGHYFVWNNMWQLYINSATFGLMLFVFSFLTNIHKRHGEYEEKSLDAIYKVDSALELKLRLMTGDTIPNPVVVCPRPKVNPLQRTIDYYAKVVGTLMGNPPSPDYDCGTYAGLIGMHDGFELRNVQSKMQEHEDQEFVFVNAEESKLFSIMSVSLPEKIPMKAMTLSHRISNAMNKACAHEMTVLGILTILKLIIRASVMKWNLTGPLLCNVPPSLIETFFMIILISGHILSDARKRVDLQNIYQRRLDLLGFVKRLEMTFGEVAYM